VGRASDLAGLHQGVNIALCLSLFEAVLRGELGDEIVVALSADKSCSENLPHFALISLKTACLVSAGVAVFAAFALAATFIMKKISKF
jgi:hypothetical protein